MDINRLNLFKVFVTLMHFKGGCGHLFGHVLTERYNDMFGFGFGLSIQTEGSDEESSPHQRSLSLKAALIATFNTPSVTLKSVGDVKVE